MRQTTLNHYATPIVRVTHTRSELISGFQVVARQLLLLMMVLMVVVIFAF